MIQACVVADSNISTSTIAIASGKGGTGKTTLAVNLAAVAARPVALLDCDVEEPNVHVFTPAAWRPAQPVTVPIPLFDAELCDRCGDCQRACRFRAIAVLPTGPMLFEELCHYCAGCLLICPTDAVSEGARPVGTLRQGDWHGVQVVEGRLNIGEASGVPLIEAVRATAPQQGLILLDAPPGTSCPVLASVQDTDYLVLVTEPTPFGLHDLKLAVEMARVLNLPCGVVLNRALDNDGGVRDYLAQMDVPLLAEIPFDRRIAEVYAGGGVIAEELPNYRELFSDLLSRILAEAEKHRQEAAPDQEAL